MCVCVCVCVCVCLCDCVIRFYQTSSCCSDTRTTYQRMKTESTHFSSISRTYDRNFSSRRFSTTFCCLPMLILLNNNSNSNRNRNRNSNSNSNNNNNNNNNNNSDDEISHFIAVVV